MRYALAIDLGSGGTKVALVEETGRVAAAAIENVTTHLLPNGGAEQDPEEWWLGVRKGVTTVIAEAGISPDQIVAIGCDAQWSVVVPVSEHGEPLMRAVHWFDTRGGPYNRAITRGVLNVQGYSLPKLRRWVRLTGIAPAQSGADSVGHILFLKNEAPEIYTKTYKFLEPQDYLTFRLTGRCTGSQASMITMLIIDNRRWGALSYDPELLSMAGLEEEKFPELLPSGGEVGPLSRSAAEELGLSESTRVVAGINDTHAAAIGSGAVPDFEGVFYIGTSAMMTCHVPFFRGVGLSRTLASMPSPIRDKYMLMAEQGTGGKNLEHYLRNIVYCDDEFDTGRMPDDAYQRVNRIAEEVPAGSGGILFLPWLTGTVAPEQNSAARAGFLNLSLDSTRRHMTRSVLEGLAYNTRWTMSAAEKFIGRKFESIRFSGGGATSDLWAQIHADVLGIPVRRVADPGYATPRGAGLFALYALGSCSADQLPHLVQIERVFEPQEANRGIYDKMYGRFRAVYRSTRRVFAALNRA
jgi:xylulokinase